MKVQDIRSFFKQPKKDESASTVTSPVVEVPSKRRRDSASKKTKEDSQSQSQSESERVGAKRSDKNKTRTESKEAKKSDTVEGKGEHISYIENKKGSKSKVEKDEEKRSSSKQESIQDIGKHSSSKESPDKQNEKNKHDKKRKSRVVSDSDDDFTVSKSPNKAKGKDINILDKRLEPNSKSLKEHGDLKLEIDNFPKINKKFVKEENSSNKKEPTSSAKEKHDKSYAKADQGTSSKKDKSPKKDLDSKSLQGKSNRDGSVTLVSNKGPSKKSDEKREKSNKSHSSLRNVNNTKPSTSAVSDDVRKVSKRPSDSIEDESDSHGNFNPRFKAPPTKMSKVSTPESKTPTRSIPIVDEQTPEQKKAQNKSNFFKYMSRNQTPRNLGSKELPIGADDCLSGLTFVMTGVLDSFERDDAKEFITKHGGRVTGSISRKTSYVIVGEEAGESKLKKAASLNVPQISEDDLLEMVGKTNPNSVSTKSVHKVENEESENLPIERENESHKKSKDNKIPSPTKSSEKSFTNNTNSKLPSHNISSSSPSAKSKSSDSRGISASSNSAKSKSSGSDSYSKSKASIKDDSTTSFRQIQPSEPSLMWVDKYKPKALKDIIGQTGESSHSKKLLRWLKNWFQYHGSSNDKAKASWPGLRDPEGKTFKCALLSGPPGIGKTTTAHLVCREIGYHYFEMNASDTRNKKGLKAHVADALSSKCITFGSNKDELTSKHVLIMDEVDGMSGNEDRGGVQELIALIKSSRVPIICICNDRNHPKIRSLANYCFDLRFNKPSFVQLKSFMLSLCFKEKIKVLPEKLQQLIVSTDQDIRQIIHQLELFKEAESYAAYNPKKDLSFGPWDVVRKVFSAPDRVGMSIHDKTGLFFQDYSLGPLFVQENYLRYLPQAAKTDVFKHMDILKGAAESIADGDLVDNILRRTNNWSLLPVQAVFSSYAPGEYMDGHCSSAPQFPMWLGKNSNKNKRSRLLQQLHSHMHLKVSGSLEALNMEYLPFLRRSIINPLANGEVQDAVEVMENYTLIREDLDNIHELTLWPGMRNNMDKVESKVKASFTRQVNKEILPYSVVKVVKAKAKGSKEEEEMEGLEEDDVIEESEEEETIDKDAMVKVKSKTSKKGSTTSKSSKSVKRNYDDDSEEDTKKSKKAKGSRKAGSSHNSKASSSKKSKK